MIRANVPLWFLWNNPKDFSKSPSICSKYCPTNNEVREAKWQNQQPVAPNTAQLFNQTITDGDSTPVPADEPPPMPPSNKRTPLRTNVLPLPLPSNEQFPKPDPVSGQRRGETMEQFFARRAARHVLMERNENPTERRSRLDRERAACNHHCL